MSKKRFGHRNKPKGKDRRLTAQSGKRNTKRRTSAKSREINPTDSDDVEGTAKTGMTIPAVRGRGDSGMLLTDPHRMRSDLQAVEQAVNKGWLVRRKTMIRRRLEEIVQKTTAEVITKNGTVDCESAADELAIKAATVLAKMDASDVDRLSKLHAIANTPPPATTPTLVTVNVNDNSTNNSFTNIVEERRSRLTQLAERIGARGLVIDGRPVPLAKLAGTAVDVQGQEPSVRPAANPASPTPG